MLRKAVDAGADVVVYDLEDAVVPSRKGEARTAVRDLLTDASFDPRCSVTVRVNPVGAGGGADVEAICEGETQPHLDGVMVPKVESATDVEAVAKRLPAHTVEPTLYALIESARGVLAAAEIAAVSDVLVFGAEDLAADLGATRTDEGFEVTYARQRVVVAAAAYGIDAIDTLVTDYDDLDLIRADAERSVQLGFDGKLAIHPSQVGPINEAFTPTADELEWAERVLAATRRAHAEDRGVFEVDGEMIDAPLIRQAERILDRAGVTDDG